MSQAFEDSFLYRQCRSMHPHSGIPVQALAANHLAEAYLSHLLKYLLQDICPCTGLYIRATEGSFVLHMDQKSVRALVLAIVNQVQIS